MRLRKEKISLQRRQTWNAASIRTMLSLPPFIVLSSFFASHHLRTLQNNIDALLVPPLYFEGDSEVINGWFTERD